MALILQPKAYSEDALRAILRAHESDLDELIEELELPSEAPVADAPLLELARSLVQAARALTRSDRAEGGREVADLARRANVQYEVIRTGIALRKVALRLPRVPRRSR